MVNIQGAQGILPNVVTDVVTQSRGVSIPGGIRIAALVGEGATTEVLVKSALGAGQDGFNPAYTSATGSDGRHFILSLAPIISNRTQLFRNGFPLVGLEGSITPTFSTVYDYMIDIETGRIALQQARILSQGGNAYVPGVGNIGKGTIQNLTLPNVNAPTETWTIKCVSVQRDGSNNPIANTAKFLSFGTITGSPLDANGNPISWIANNTVVSNGTLSFSILEGATVLREGDLFVIKVVSGVLIKNDTLTVTYIPAGNINDPTFFDNMNDLSAKHGQVSTDNTLALGSSLAFANGTPGVLAMQAAPALPRRTSYVLDTATLPASTNPDDFIFPFPVNAVPDINSDIHVFFTNPATGIEKQYLPNKLAFYTFTGTGDGGLPAFINDNTAAPSGHSFFYTVVKDNAVFNFGLDGYINSHQSNTTTAFFSSATASNFDSTYVGREVKVFDGYNVTNNGTFPITAVNNGVLTISALNAGVATFAPFVTHNTQNLTFQLVDSSGALVGGGAAADGYLTAGPAGQATVDGYFFSGSIPLNLTGFPNILSYKLRISGDPTVETNIGLFDIVAVIDANNHEIQIRKSFVDEHLLHFEVLDTTLTSEYLVLNHNVVPATGGQLRVTIVDAKDAPFFDAGWENALAALELVECDILVPLPKSTISAVFQNFLTHCLTMSNIRNRKERVLFIGAINGLTPSNLTGQSLAAVENLGVLEGLQGATVSDILSGNTEDLANYSVPNSYGNTFRAVYFYPDQIVVQIGASNTIVDGFYLGAAAGGYLSGLSNLAMPLTNKNLTGFTILKNRMLSPTNQESLAAAGVTILQPINGGGRVLWGITTSQSGAPEEQEISIVFIRDRIAKSFRAGFAGYIGMPEDNDTIPTLTARALGLLHGFVSQGMLTDFANLSVTRDPVEPRQWNINVLVQVAYPINWIYIKVGVGLI